MALLDYKITNLSNNNRHVRVTIRVYRGAYQDIVERVRAGETEVVNRYVRQAKVRERTFNFDIPRDMDISEVRRKARALLNKRLLDWATANGHTVITEQQDVSEYEPMDNESEI